MLAVSLVFLVFCYFTNERRSAVRFKKEHPVLTVLLVVSGSYFLSYMLGALLVFLVGILAPFCGKSLL